MAQAVDALAEKGEQLRRDGIVIRTYNLWKTYVMGEEEIHAVAGVDIEIHKGEYVALMGPSGSGKSTLMNLIGCLDTPTGGQYFINGRLVSDMDDDELARIRNKEIGFVFQTFNLLPRATALHNVELPLIYAGVPADRREQLAKESMRHVDLEHRMYHKPAELSGGQRQRVAIARALVNNPSILLADEPTGNLDTATGNEIMAIFDRLHQQGNTIILVTHELEVALHAKRILHLRDGKIEKDEVLPGHDSGPRSPYRQLPWDLPLKLLRCGFSLCSRFPHPARRPSPLFERMTAVLRSDNQSREPSWLV